MGVPKRVICVFTSGFFKAKELRAEIAEIQKESNKLRTEKDKLESMVSSLDGFLQKRAEKMRISLDELEARFNELVSLEQEMASKRSEKAKLAGEIEALNERHKKLFSLMEKASADFDRDMKSIGAMRNELLRIAQMKGRYDREVEDMAWAEQILPFSVTLTSSMALTSSSPRTFLITSRPITV